MNQKCMNCGKPIGYWAYCSHGERFCSLDCMNKTYHMTENSENLMENATI